MRNTEPTVTVSEAASLMKVHANTALRLVQAGEIPAARVGRAYVLMTRHVLDYIEKQVVTQTAARLRRP